MENALVWVVIFVGLAFLVLVGTMFSMFKNQQKKVDDTPIPEKIQLEFSKLIMLVMLGMWVLGGLIGFWVVLNHEFSFLAEVQSYVSYPVTAGIGVYGAKSGAENWKKLSASTKMTKEEEKTDE